MNIFTNGTNNTTNTQFLTNTVHVNNMTTVATPNSCNVQPNHVNTVALISNMSVNVKVKSTCQTLNFTIKFL